MTICNISLDSIKELINCKGLKYLKFFNVCGFDFNEIGFLENITELALEKEACENLDFLSKLKKLQKLSLQNVKIPNLSFLDDLRNLTTFKADEKAVDESNVKFISGLSKIKELNYPISDLELIKPCTKLTEICIDASNYTGIEVLAQTKISSVTLYGAVSEEHAKSTIAKIKQYCSLTSYGWKQTWDK